MQFCPIPNKTIFIAVSWRKIRRNEFWKANEFWKMFLLHKAKSFVVIYLHYNSDIIFWISKKKEILRGSQPKFLQRKSAGGIKRSLKRASGFIILSFKHVEVCKVLLSILIKFHLKSICFQRSLYRFWKVKEDYDTHSGKFIA